MHELIREHSMAAGRRVKEEGAQNDLLERIAKDSNFSAVHATLDQLLDPAVSDKQGCDILYQWHYLL